MTRYMFQGNGQSWFIDASSMSEAMMKFSQINPFPFMTQMLVTAVP